MRRSKEYGNNKCNFPKDFFFFCFFNCPSKQIFKSFRNFGVAEHLLKANKTLFSEPSSKVHKCYLEDEF